MSIKRSLATLSLGLALSFALLASLKFLAQPARADNFNLSSNCLAGIGDVNTLIDAIDTANSNGQDDTIILAANCVYTLTAINNMWFGPNGLPAITSTIIISGHGATILRDSASAFRFFYISGGEVVPSGNLILQNLTLRNGQAQGGQGVGGGGGGSGLGGAIFNEGGLRLVNTTLVNNRAIGGDGSSGNAGGGGGISGSGGDSGSSTGGNGLGGGGGFGGFGGTGGLVSGSDGGGGGGGGGFNSPGDNGTNDGGDGGGDTNGGAGGDFNATGGGNGSNGNFGGGGGGGGGAANDNLGGSGGHGGFGGGGGGTGVGSTGNAGNGGNGGVGGGGGAGFNAGAGGFGGGGGGGFNAGAGGFGGGGGGGFDTGGSGGFGGGPGSNGFSSGGGGGGGLGGAVFNLTGILYFNKNNIYNNSARGGNPSYNQTAARGGSGFGGGIFNLNGQVIIINSTIANNSVLNSTLLPVTTPAGGGIYSLGDGQLFEDGAQSISIEGNARLALTNTIVANTPNGHSDCVVNNKDSGVSVTVGTNNLIENNNGCVTNNLKTEDPQLGSLQDNGGDTETLALLDGSPAIDAGDNSNLPIFDQRGSGFPRISGSKVDIGAFEIQMPPDLSLSKTVTPGIVRPGQTITYTLTFSNIGGSLATNVILTDIIPITLTNLSVISSGVVITDTGIMPGYVWQVQDLTSNQGGVITITGQIIPTITNNSHLTNTSTITSSADVVSDNNNAAIRLDIVPQIDLGLSKTGIYTTNNDITTITYTITISNVGPDHASAVIVSDTLPVQVTFVASHTSNNSNYNFLAWTVGSLVPGEWVTLTVVTTASVVVGESITNTATINANNQNDIIDDNNEDSLVITIKGDNTTKVYLPLILKK